MKHHKCTLLLWVWTSGLLVDDSMAWLVPHKQSSIGNIKTRQIRKPDGYEQPFVAFSKSSNDEQTKTQPNDSLLRPLGNENQPGDVQHYISTKKDMFGFAVLLTVPLAWGTYEPAVRYVYALDPPVPGFLFSFSYFFIAAVTLTVLAFAQKPNMNDATVMPDAMPNVRNETTATALQSSTHEDQQQNVWPLKEGFELGSYLWLGNTLQVLGLQNVASDRAAFLLQLNTIIVPILQALVFVPPELISEKWFARIPTRTWAACFIAIMGVVFMGFDDGGADGSQETSILLLSNWSVRSLSFGIGDGFILLAAVIYSFHIIRLETHAKNVSALRLASVKASTETALTALSVFTITLLSLKVIPDDPPENQLFFNFAKEQGDAIISYLSFIAERGLSESPDTILSAVLATAWTGLVTIAYTIYAQSVGQKSVDAVTANLIYTVQPVYTAIIAWFLLRERLSIEGYIGAALIGGAVLLASTQPSHDQR